MYWIKRYVDDEGKWIGIVLPLTTVERSVHLFPKFGPVAPREWTSSNVLEECASFYVSCWSDRHTFIIIQ
jgi:hypothetical protein